MAADEGFLDPDTRETMAAGRRTVGDMLGAAQAKGRRIFVVFAVGLLGTVYALRAWIWPQLEADLLAREASIVAITPFDVILLQAKIGIVVGILLSIPPLIYYSREPLKDRGLYPEEGVASWKLGAILTLSTALFSAGVFYSYNVFFPVMFEFLASNAVSAGLSPTYSIVDWTQFIFVLALSFGLAAQLPLVMTALSYAEIVPYETFRDKWKYAIVGMFGFGALFSPPDPFTQLMWAAPLVALYAFSLYLARLAAGLRRGDGVDVVGSVRANAPALAGTFVLVGGVAFWFLTSGVGYVNRALLPRLPASIRPAPIDVAGLLPVPPAVAAGIAGLLAVVVLTLFYARPRLDVEAGRPGAPGAIDLDPLDADGVRAAPPEAFADMDEETMVEHAERAMDAEDYEKAQAIVDRYEEAQEEDDAEDATEEPAAGDEGGGGGAVQRATADVVDSVSEDEVTEDDIGGYYYDIRFVLGSLRSKAFRIFLVFIGVLVGVFGFLYSGGIGLIKEDFLSRIPDVVRPEEIKIVTLHPVEALVFEVKISTLLGAVAVLPMLLYYAWPALKERGVAGGDRDVFLTWGVAILGGLLVGSALGYLYVAPAVISYLVYDAVQANMVIAYRVSNFFWLVFFTTVGIGIWVDIPITMVLFHRGGIVPFSAMRARWREVTLGVMAVTALLTPATVLSMILVTIPIMLAYGLGLGILWVYTLGGRRAPRPVVEGD